MKSFDFGCLTDRHREPEWMDEPEVNAGEHRRSVDRAREDQQIESEHSILWPGITRLARDQPGDPLRMLDLACGGGDVTIALARNAAQAGLGVRVEGCDVSDEAVRFARDIAARSGVNVGFFRLNALRDPIPEGYDVIACSLFLHHLDEADAILLLQKMGAAARRLVLVNDLERTRWATGLPGRVVDC